MIPLIIRITLLVLLGWACWKLISRLGAERSRRHLRSGQPISVADELEKLSRLREEGVLTAAEFEAQKQIVLRR